MSAPNARSLFLSALSLLLVGASPMNAQDSKHSVQTPTSDRGSLGGRTGTGGPVNRTVEGVGKPGGGNTHQNDSAGRITASPQKVGEGGRPAATGEVPSFSPRCTVPPTAAYWQHRDLFKEIQSAARRRAYLPISAVAESARQLTGVALSPAGWKAYSFVVPPSGKLHVRLHHPNEAWFRVVMTNKWGGMSEGMLQNLIPTGNPEATFLNPSKTEAQAIYVIVDDPGWMSSEARPFVIDVECSWQPGNFDPKGVQPVQGIWSAQAHESESSAKTSKSGALAQ